MNISKQFLMVLVVALLTFSCSPLRGKKAIVVNDDGRSMRYNNGRAEGNTKKWNSTRSLGKQQKKRDKAFRKRRRN
ncbi:hypothetical protein [Pontibacter diazotrophicus]|uniref:hypothetical protein n=1 Tax=Pontibacter diazotrophicus TaxID=1400979 RepID=UPI0011C0631D|nr:hypothetical protein [Pontibacter diazotrophicus]